jgi:hypothetical protein
MIFSKVRVVDTFEFYTTCKAFDCIPSRCTSWPLNAIIPDTIYNANPGIPHICTVRNRTIPQEISIIPTNFVFFI